MIAKGIIDVINGICFVKRRKEKKIVIRDNSNTQSRHLYSKITWEIGPHRKINRQ